MASGSSRIRWGSVIWSFAIAVVAVMLPGLAWAHAAEQGFVLLMPTDIYIAAGAATVAASIVLVGLVPVQAVVRVFRPLPLRAVLCPERAATGVSLLSTLVFLALVWLGFKGPNDPLANLLPLTIWTLLWVMFVVLQAVFGDLWRWLNPWTGLYRVVAASRRPPFQLPQAVGSWFAVALLILLNLFALADLAPDDPERLAVVALAYWVITFLGMVLFGAQDWLARVEVFSVFFRLMARLSPLRFGPRPAIGWPGWQALERPETDPSRAVFCLVLLGSGSFDGLHETFWWLAQIGINPLEFPGRSAVVWPSTLGLLAGNIVLVAIFALAVAAGMALACGQERRARLGPAFTAFSVSILPIALGYHVAHYLPSFLVQIQYVGVALGDPFERGWHLFGLGHGHVTTGFLNNAATVRVLWLTQAGAVVASHVVSVLMAHHVAVHLVQGRSAVLRCQAGLAILMIVYTIFGLWLLASPRGV